MGCNDGKGGAAIAVSDATAAMSDDTRAAPVNLLRPPPHQLRRNSDPRREDSSAKFGGGQKGRGKPKLSSSVSILEQEIYCIGPESARDPRGAGIREPSIERCPHACRNKDQATP